MEGVLNHISSFSLARPMSSNTVVYIALDFITPNMKLELKNYCNNFSRYRTALEAFSLDWNILEFLY